MSDDQRLDRRAFLKRAVNLGGVAVAAPSLVTLVGCKHRQGRRASDVVNCGAIKGGLTDEQQRQRKKINYVEKSPHGDKQSCGVCQYYLQATGEHFCGSCGIVSGPINPHGHCNQWMPIQDNKDNN